MTSGSHSTVASRSGFDRVLLTRTFWKEDGRGRVPKRKGWQHHPTQYIFPPFSSSKKKPENNQDTKISPLLKTEVSGLLLGELCWKRVVVTLINEDHCGGVMVSGLTALSLTYSRSFGGGGQMKEGRRNAL
ncbi:hypothetical protein CEXT_319741 [Caerostris extrusa]|uniref:Uncharacterized protein n=1 Tax=Caerostris extrusa TaxID=172846 RepID=A0AAV4XTS2_CAEEX|nr:hypothetical protein CEXT_319741 [Caerostris extrusa]